MTQGQSLARPESRADLIESKLNRDIADKLAITMRDGGTTFENMAEVLEFAKLMSISRQAVPQHCREQPGVCLGITIQAVEWRMSPFAVANKSYVVNDRLSYESQLIHAIVEQRAPITGRLRHEFNGQGDSRKCRVWAIDAKSGEELSYESPAFSTINPKNSPLWKTKPDLQLYYNTSRDWARVYFPDVILGVYSSDEILDSAPVAAAPAAEPGVAGLRERIALTNDDAIAGEPDIVEAKSLTDANAIDTEPAPEPEQKLSAKESKRLDLITSINELLGEVYGGDVEEMAGYLGGRDLTTMSTMELKDAYNDLYKKAKAK